MSEKRPGDDCRVDIGPQAGNPPRDLDGAVLAIDSTRRPIPDCTTGTHAMPSAILNSIPRAARREQRFGDQRRAPLVSRAEHAGNSKCRRKLADPAACEGDHAAAGLELMQAMEGYKRRNGHMFPTRMQPPR